LISVEPHHFDEMWDDIHGRMEEKKCSKLRKLK
jgi:hypothetical protein